MENLGLIHNTGLDKSYNEISVSNEHAVAIKKAVTELVTKLNSAFEEKGLL